MTMPAPIARNSACIVVLMVAVAATPAAAVTVDRMQVSRDAAAFDVDALITLAVTPATAWRAATDYERLPQFNPSVLETKRLEGHRLRSEIRLCVALICKRLRQVMHYREQAPERIDMQVVAGQGDFKRGAAHWRFSPVAQGRHTRLRFTARLVPDFWIPPLIGNYLVARELRRQARVTAAAIERLGEQASQHDRDHG